MHSASLAGGLVIPKSSVMVFRNRRRETAAGAFRQLDFAHFGAQFFPLQLDVGIGAGAQLDLQSGKARAATRELISSTDSSSEMLRSTALVTSSSTFDAVAPGNCGHEQAGPLRDRRVFLLPELGERNRAPDQDRDQRRPGDAAMVDAILRPGRRVLISAAGGCDMPWQRCDQRTSTGAPS